jgi:hypothetical protein
MSPISGTSGGPGVPGVRGDGQTDNDGIQGFAQHPDHVGVLGVGGGAGVKGDCPNGDGVQGFTQHPNHVGVIGVGGGAGVKGDCPNGDGVQGFSKNFDHAGVIGVNSTGVGVKGFSEGHDGVEGFTQDGNRAGVVGTNTGTGNGVLGQCENGVGVHATSTHGTGLVASGGRLAGFFDGDVEITRVLKVKVDVQLDGGDLAEQFSVAGDVAVEPGCVVVLAGDDCVRLSDQPYDRRVAGVVSGAGNYRPGLILDRQAGADRRPLALSGKVWCKVDADCAPVELGDLLTTSPTPGHAMRATDSARAFGAVIGKALGSLPSGQALVPVLVALQ